MMVTQSPTISRKIPISCKDIREDTHSHARCCKMDAALVTIHVTWLSPIRHSSPLFLTTCASALSETSSSTRPHVGWLLVSDTHRRTKHRYARCCCVYSAVYPIYPTGTCTCSLLTCTHSFTVLSTHVLDTYWSNCDVIKKDVHLLTLSLGHAYHQCEASRTSEHRHRPWELL